MNKLIIVRHGETIENKRRICQGHSEGILSANGRLKNSILAKELSQYKIDALYSSPLNRAIQTGNAIMKYHNNLSLQIDPRLIERNMGILQGCKFPVDFTLNSHYEGMESLDDITARLELLLEDLDKKHQNQTILLVSHGITIALLRALLMNIPISDFDKQGPIGNSTFFVYGF